MKTILGWIVGLGIMMGLTYIFKELTGGWFLSESGSYTEDGSEILNGTFLCLAIVTVAVWVGIKVGGGETSTHWLSCLTGFFFIMGCLGYMAEQVDINFWLSFIPQIVFFYGGGYILIKYCLGIDREIADRKRRLTE